MFHSPSTVQSAFTHDDSLHCDPTTQIATTNVVPVISHQIPTKLNFLSVNVTQPVDQDVLIGLNKGSKHPGNCILQELIECHLDEYNEARTKNQRMMINRKLIQQMHWQHGSRFLQRNKSNGSWCIALESAVRDKVSHALRYASQRKEKKRLQELMVITQKNNDDDDDNDNDDDRDIHDAIFKELENSPRTYQALVVLHKTQTRILNELLSQPELVFL